MNLKILLLFLFILGLSLIRCENECDQNFKLKKSKISQVIVNSNSVQDSAIIYSNLSLSLQIKELIGSNFQASGLVNACEPAATGNYLNTLDSFSITLNKDYGSIKAGESFIGNLKFEQSNLVVSEIELFRLLNERYSNTPRFLLIRPPTQKDTFQFSFVFKDIHDSLFIAKSKQIIISP